MIFRLISFVQDFDIFLLGGGPTQHKGSRRGDGVGIEEKQRRAKKKKAQMHAAFGGQWWKGRWARQLGRSMGSV